MGRRVRGAARPAARPFGLHGEVRASTSWCNDATMPEAMRQWRQWRDDVHAGSRVHMQARSNCRLQTVWPLSLRVATGHSHWLAASPGVVPCRPPAGRLVESGAPLSPSRAAATAPPARACASRSLRQGRQCRRSLVPRHSGAAVTAETARRAATMRASAGQLREWRAAGSPHASRAPLSLPPPPPLPREVPNAVAVARRALPANLTAFGGRLRAEQRCQSTRLHDTA